MVPEINWWAVALARIQMKALETTGALVRHPFHGEWNYTLNPIQNDTPEPR